MFQPNIGVLSISAAFAVRKGEETDDPSHSKTKRLDDEREVFFFGIFVFVT